MPLALNLIREDFKLLVWHISENLDFFSEKISYRSTATNTGRIEQQMASRYLLELMHPAFPFDKVHAKDGGKLVLPASTPNFCLSHCSQFAAAIMSAELSVGIDIEKIDPKVLKVAPKFLNQSELDWLSNLDIESQKQYTTLCWSIKETVFKWWGNGGVDFANHIHIPTIDCVEEGMVLVNFKGSTTHVCNVHFKLLGNHWLTYMAAVE